MSVQLDIEIQRFKNCGTKMKPEVKSRLVEALRSGKYKQTNGYLQFIKTDEFTSPGFCCLGVLSEIAKNDPEIPVDSRLHPCGDSMEYFSTVPKSDPGAFDKSTAFLIDEVAEWSGITAEVSGALMGVNDNGGSFELIADLVEEYL